VRDSLLAAMGNVMPAHLLDARLQGGAVAGGTGAKDPWLDQADGCGSAREEATPLLSLALRARSTE